jgi:hypothetical protein
MSIWFHGTTKKCADKILKEGFNAGTNFARHLEDSLVMGGRYIFWVFFEKDPTKCWEYICDKWIGPENILLLRRYDVERIYQNDKLAEKIRLRNLVEYNGENIELCRVCRGKGEIDDREWDEPRKERNQPLVVCSKCNGFGFVRQI